MIGRPQSWFHLSVFIIIISVIKNYYEYSIRIDKQGLFLLVIVANGTDWTTLPVLCLMVTEGNENDSNDFTNFYNDSKL